MSTEQEAKIKELARALSTGAKRKDLVAKYCELWQTSQRTFDGLLAKARKLAPDLLERREKKIQEALDKTATDAAVKELRPALDVDMRIQEIIFSDPRLISSKKPGKDGKEVDIIHGVHNKASDVIRAAHLYYRRNNLLGKGNGTTGVKIVFKQVKKPNPPNATA